MIERFRVSRDESIYEAFPDVALAPSGRLVCVFAECTHHHNRDYTRMMVCDSTDRGRTWSPKRPLTEALRGDPRKDPFWDCPRVVCLSDGRLAAVTNRVARLAGDGGGRSEESNWLQFSEDEGQTWTDRQATPVEGIVPDRLVELASGRWVLAAHTAPETDGERAWQVRCWLSDDAGASWRGPITIAAKPPLQLCEPSVFELGGGELVCLMRENSRRGLDAFKCVSRDGGESWTGPVPFPLPGCHRPVGGLLDSGRVLVTYRFLPGGRGGLGWWTQNTFAALTDVESCLAEQRAEAGVRILPLDYDRSREADTGYTGWVQLDDGEIYVVNYLLDDAAKAWIRGYALRESDFVIEPA